MIFVPTKSNPGDEIPMANYQLTHLDLSTRLELAGLMLNPMREWGQVSQLAQQYGVSRKFLYGLAGQAQQALQSALLPKEPGRKAECTPMVVDDALIERMIAACLTIVPGTIRPIQTLLKILFGVHRSTGTICQTAQRLGERALTYQRGLHLPLAALAEADEIFQGRQPCLTLVDGRSFLVLNLSAEEHRDATTWGCVLLDVQHQGVQLLDLASDGARGIRAGVEAAQLAIPLPPDLFHLLREAHHVTQRLEKHAYRTIETAERVRRAIAEQQASKKRRGRKLHAPLALPEAEAAQQQALAQLSAWLFLLGEIRLTLEPWNADGYLSDPQDVRKTLLTAIDLLRSLQCETVDPFANLLMDKLTDLLAPLEWLGQRLAPWRSQMDRRTEAALVWTWLHQQELGVSAQDILALDQQPLVTAVWEALNLFHRSSALAESLHSWLRPYLQVHRGMPDWLLPLLQLVWNHHAFSRGKRAGDSPMTLAGIPNSLTLNQLFDCLVRGSKSDLLPG
jgi:hypothetical protein